MAAGWAKVRKAHLPAQGLATYFSRRKSMMKSKTMVLSDAQMNQIKNQSKTVNLDQQLGTILREAAVSFLAIDGAGDGELDFEDFKKLLPHGEEMNEQMLREAFGMADADGSGTISKTEYFLWTLNVASRSAGMGAMVDKQLRESFDKSGDGKLNMVEFVEAAEEFGFGSIAHDIFLELDADGSGFVSFNEIHEMMRGVKTKVSTDCKKFLTALSFDWCTVDADKVDRSPWNAPTPKALRSGLNMRLKRTLVKVSDLWVVMLIGAKAKQSIKRDDFIAAMKATGFVPEDESHEEMLYDVFDEVWQAWSAGTHSCAPPCFDYLSGVCQRPPAIDDGCLCCVAGGV